MKDLRQAGTCSSFFPAGISGGVFQLKLALLLSHLSATSISQEGAGAVF
jgi:hypothetical protein